MSSHPAGKSAIPRAHSSATSDSPGRFRRISLGLLYLITLSLLVVWEYRERLEVLSSDCELRDQVKSSLYNRPYERFLDWASSDAAGHVVALAIPSDLEEVQKNLCLGREYMADVLRALAPQTPSVVVIDKFYSPGSCTSAPASTQNLIQAVGALKIPVVIGESTNGLEHEQANSCLVRRSQLDFRASNVTHGLTRLNGEPERLPLRWLVLSSAPEEGSHPSVPERAAPAAGIPKVEFADSLSLAAVKAYDPAFAARRKIRQLVLSKDHAYANLAIEIPRITTTQLLCAAGDEKIRKRWSLSCGPAPTLPNLAGRVVVIGAETSDDRKLVLDQHIWGFELQARYIEALLSGDYLRYLPIWWGLILFTLFIFLMEGLPTILIARHPGWKRLPLLRYAYRPQRYLWVVFWAITTLVVSAFVALALRYLPPLLVYVDILIVAVTRLLFTLAEAAEHPFIHAHTSTPAPTRRKAHPMSKPEAVHTKTAPSTTSTQSSRERKAPPMKPFVPDEPAEPSPVPVNMEINKPGSEGGTEG